MAGGEVLSPAGARPLKHAARAVFIRVGVAYGGGQGILNLAASAA
jgi:hypothetical protein